MFVGMLVALLRVLSLPIYLLMRLHDEITGEGRWYREQVCSMQSERPPLSDAAFLSAVSAELGDGPLWLAVRQAIADSIGVVPEAVYPQDRLADLWRMQWIGPDMLDLIFRLEAILKVKLVRPSIEEYTGQVRYGQAGEFGEFAAALVRGLREIQDRIPASRGS
jgi:hypothetical protein